MPPAATVEGVEIYDSGIVMASLLLCNSHILARHKPHTFVGNLVLNHSQTACFWVGVSFVAEQLPRCDLLKVSPRHKGCVFFFWTSLVAQMVKRPSTMWDIWVRSLGRKIPWRRKWQPTPILLPRKSHGWRSLVQEEPGAGYCPWGRKESDTTERLHFHFI